MSSRTKYLSRLIGFSSILVSLSLIAHKQATLEMITALVYSSPVLFAMGLIGVVAGVAMVLGHNVWSGGPLPVVVTLIGWLILIKGLLFLFLSQERLAHVILDRLQYERLFYLYPAISLLLGVYLVVAGGRAIEVDPK